jgi:hypothetical protein
LPGEKIGPARQRERDLIGEPLDAFDALPLRAELLVKNDVLEFRQPVLQPRLEIGLVEELGVGEPRADDPLVAGDDRLATVLRLDIGDENKFVSESALVLRDGALRLLRMRRGEVSAENYALALAPAFLFCRLPTRSSTTVGSASVEVSPSAP